MPVYFLPIYVVSGDSINLILDSDDLVKQILLTTFFLVSLFNLKKNKGEVIYFKLVF